MRLSGALTLNHVLARLPGEELEQLRPLLLRVRLVKGQVLIERGQATEHVFFIEEGVVALVAQPRSGSSGVQVAMIGREGIVGSLILLDDSSVAFASAVTQVAGTALRIPVAELRRLCAESATLRKLCAAYVQSLTRQIMAESAWNACNSLPRRYAHWLLMAHERVPGDVVLVTHSELSALLGVRRSGVTMAAAMLQRAGLIRTLRGQVCVLDRPGLEAFLNIDASGTTLDSFAASTPPGDARHVPPAPHNETYKEAGRS